MDAFELVIAATTGARSPNIWGALACATGFAASLFAILDAFADFILARGDSSLARLTPGKALKFGSKLAGAAIVVVTSALVLALDQNWFAFWALSIAFTVVVGIGVWVLLRHSRSSEPMGAPAGR